MTLAAVQVRANENKRHCMFQEERVDSLGEKTEASPDPKAVRDGGTTGHLVNCSINKKRQIYSHTRKPESHRSTALPPAHHSRFI